MTTPQVDDVLATVAELLVQQVAYRAALGVTQRVVTPSLADFLR